MKIDGNVLRAVRAGLLMAAVFSAGAVQAALTTNWVQVNGASTVMVAPGASITATVNETNTAGSNWRSTKFTVTPGTIAPCNNHSDFNGNGTYTLDYSLTVPATEGLYGLAVFASSNDTCGGTTSNTVTLPNAIRVNNPPTVSSIVRASPNPTTSNATVSWTVTFSEAVTGVDAGDFALVKSGGSGGVIVAVSGSGTTYTVTANVGSGGDALRLDLVDNDTIVDNFNMPLGGVGNGNGNAVGESYLICAPPPGAPAGVTCICDTFDRTALNPSPIFNSHWVVSTSDSTGLLPSIVGGRLRLTSATNNNAKAATVPGLFPGAGNYISVEFRYYAYGGSGADGIAVTLSDAAVPAVPGAYGGSLGYAQRCGVVGFAGGWLGVGIDEYGNFSNDNECRGDGGPPTARVLDSVSIRGSGSGMTGYLLHAGSGALSPGVDQPGSTPAPGHRYRVIVDHSNNANAQVQVQRDTTGAGYTNLVTPYDAKAKPGQANVPDNWQLSFTGSTGGATNIHEIDDLRICATTIWPLTGGVASGFNAIDEAYGNASGSPKPAVQQYLTGHIYTKLIDQSFNLNVAALANNQVLTSYVTSGDKYLQVKLVDNSDDGCQLDSSKPDYCNAACVSKPAVSSGSQVLTFSSSDAGQKRTANFILKTAYRKLAVVLRECTTSACTAFTSTPAACATDQFSVRPRAVHFSSTTATQAGISGLPRFRAGSDQFSVAVTVPGAAGSNPSGYNGTLVIDSPQPVSPAIFAGTLSPASFPAASPGTPHADAEGFFTYSEVGAFRLRGYDPSSDATSVRGIRDETWTLVDSPGTQGDCIAGSYSNTKDANGKVGCLFGLIADTPAIGRFIPHALVVEQNRVDRSTTGTAVSGSTALTVASPTGFAVGDQVIVTGAGSGGGPLTTTVTAISGNTLTLAAAALTSVSNATVVHDGDFKYMDQPLPLAFTLKAVNAGGVVTKNYQDTLAKLDPGNAALWPATTLGNTGFALGARDGTGLGGDLSTRLVLVGTPTGSWNKGEATITANVKLTRPANTTPTAGWGPFDTMRVGIAPHDADGVTVSSMNFDADGDGVSERFLLGQIDERLGRLRLVGAYGSELLPLRVEGRTEYWNGTQWARNILDSTTTIAQHGMSKSGGIASSVCFLSDPPPSSPTSAQCLPNSGGSGSPLTTMSSGKAAWVVFSSGTAGYTDLAIDLSAQPWLRSSWSGSGTPFAEDPVTRVRFGSARAPFIYFRERY